MTTAKEDRLIFCTTCVAEVFPGVRDDLQPKHIIFHQAAMWGVDRTDCPPTLKSFKKLRRYIKNHWPTIRIMLAAQEDIVPVYVDGIAFGGGGGYRKGDEAHVQKQVARDKKIADGVVNAANNYADAVGAVFPQIERSTHSLVSRRLR